MSIYNLGSSTDSLSSSYSTDYDSDSSYIEDQDGSSVPKSPSEHDSYPTRDTVNPRDSIAGHLTDRLSNWANSKDNATSCLNNRVTVGLSHAILAVGGLVETFARPFFAVVSFGVGIPGVLAAKIASLFTSRFNHVNTLQKWHNQVTAPILAGTIYSGVSIALSLKNSYKTLAGESTEITSGNEKPFLDRFVDSSRKDITLAGVRTFQIYRDPQPIIIFPEKVSSAPTPKESALSDIC